MDLTKYTKQELEQIIRNYNLHYHIKKFSKLKRGKLEEVITKFMNFVDGELVNIVNEPIELPKQKVKKVRIKKEKRARRVKQVKHVKQEEKEEEKPLKVMEQTRKELDKEVEEHNRIAKIFFDKKMKISREFFDERKKAGEKMTASKIKTLKKNVILKNPELKQMQEELWEMSDTIGKNFKDLGEWGLKNGLTHKEVSRFVSNVRILDVS